MIILNETLREETKNKLEKGEKMRTCFQEIKSLQKDREKLSSELTKKMESLSRLNTRNVNKRISRIKNKNFDLTKENEEKTLQLEEFKVVNDQLVKDLDKALAEGIKYRKKASYYKRKYEKSNDSENDSVQSIIKDLNQQIQALENEKMMLNEKIDTFLSREICCFEKGKYNDVIRMVYEDILMMGVSTRNVEKVIRLVLEKVAGIKVDRLPSECFARYMLVEARGLAQYQIAFELVDNCSDMTLHSDGTSKKGRSYLTFDGKTNDGRLYVLGLREVGAADAQSQLDVFCEVLEEVCKTTGDDGNCKFNKVFASIKNLMSDRCATQKKFNNLFVEYRKQIVPLALKDQGWENLSQEQQKKILNVNEFYCGLHFLVGMADQAEACLKVWEGILFKDDNNIVGSLKHGGDSNGESGTTRLIRTVCKAVQQRGCEKSGRMVSFETFMKEEFGMAELPLFPFLGNRFNILFLNGAGTFYLYEKLVDFFKKF